MSLGTRGYPAPTSLRFLYLSCIRQNYCQSDENVKPQLFRPHTAAGWYLSLLQRHHCKSFHPKNSQCITVRELYVTSYSQSLPPNLTIRTAWERAWEYIEERFDKRRLYPKKTDAMQKGTKHRGMSWLTRELEVWA